MMVSVVMSNETRTPALSWLGSVVYDKSTRRQISVRRWIVAVAAWCGGAAVERYGGAVVRRDHDPHDSPCARAEWGGMKRRIAVRKMLLR
jgi:hypothetical protein